MHGSGKLEYDDGAQFKGQFVFGVKQGKGHLRSAGPCPARLSASPHLL